MKIHAVKPDLHRRKLRKNASLKSTAEATYKDAKRILDNYWEEYNRVKNASPSYEERGNLDDFYTIGFATFRDAQRLYRFAGLDFPE